MGFSPVQTMPTSIADRSAAAPLTVTLVLFNSGRHLQECLRSFVGSVRSGFAEIVAVDNATPDNSVEILSQEVPETRVVRSPTNKGFAGGCNLAWPHMSTRYWMLLNPDTVVPEGGLETLVAWMDAHPDVGAASPNIVASDGNPQYVARRFPSAALILTEALRIHRLFPARRRARLLLGPLWKEGDLTDGDWVSGTALIVRREAVEAAGLLSERYFMYGEDIEWCWRLQKAGWKVGLCSSVTVQHRVKGSSRETWSENEMEARWLGGYYQACVQLRGRIGTLAIQLANVLAMAIESMNPRRTREERRVFLQAMLAHVRARPSGVAGALPRETEGRPA
jgi:N-acetylglucosaminyl-diphospho-decaprenol L-rhamnosyltransferase